MATGYGGISGKGSLGLWGPALFSIPLLVAWYSFELGRRTRRTFRQTVQALGVAPELGGLTQSGHVERVAELAVAIARTLGVDEGQSDDLETAAWLHHLGAVCLDEPEPGHSLDPSDVARAGAEMLRASRALSDAGDIIAAESGRIATAGEGKNARALAMGEILKVANDYDDLTSGDDSQSRFALDALSSRPTTAYDARVLKALGEVLRTAPGS
jgi:response regulator RpfG family c-di-GMP phosphodiesterase